MKSVIMSEIDDSILFTWCRLSLRTLFQSAIGSKNGIPIVFESPYGKTLINLLRPAVPRVYYGKDLNIKYKSFTHTARFTYGLQSGSHSVGSIVTSFVTKPLNYYLLRMCTYLSEKLLRMRNTLGLQSVDLSREFNHVTKLLYIADRKLKPTSSMGFHCDITYNHNGIYVKSKNGQMDNTPTVIVVIGDSRTLKWERQILTITSSGRKKWMTDPSFNAIVVLKDCSILIVNPLDEIGIFDNELGHIVRYRHGGVKVNGSKLSIGFAFRVVSTWAVYDNNNRLTNMNGNADYDVGKKLDSVAFHNDLNNLYNYTFN